MALRRAIPPSLRKQAAKQAERLLLPRAHRPQSCGRGEPTIVGLLNAPSGLGRSARICLQSFDRLGFHPKAFDVTATFNPTYQATLDGRISEVADSGGRGPIIVHLNPPEVLPGLLKLWLKNPRHRYRVGVWHWELEVVPQIWVEQARFFNEIWVPSHFIEAALNNAGISHTRVIPHPISVPTPAPARARFNLPENRFVVLAMLDLSSMMARKNPVAVIEAFRQAFGQDEDALLLLKVTGRSDRSEDFALLRAMAGALGNVRILSDLLSEEATMSLISSCDVLLSLHRSEGFGMAPAEAMLSGVPVIATAWSGNMDFMNEELVCLVNHKFVPVAEGLETYGGLDARWAEPSVEEAAGWLRELKGNKELARTKAARAKAFAEDFFDIDRYAQSVESSIGDYLPRKR